MTRQQVSFDAGLVPFWLRALTSCAFFTYACRRWYLSSYSLSFLLRLSTVSLAWASLEALSLSISASCSLVVALSSRYNTSNSIFSVKVRQYPYSAWLFYRSITFSVFLALLKVLWLLVLFVQCWLWFWQNRIQLLQPLFISLAWFFIRSIAILVLVFESRSKASRLGSLIFQPQPTVSW